MKTKNKIKKVGKSRVYKKRKTMEEEIKKEEIALENEPKGGGSVENTLETPKEEVKIVPFSGDFGRVDINLLRDKVNEVISFLNK